MENYWVEKVATKEAKEFVKEHHYSHGIHNGPMTYGLFKGLDLIGVCAFANPCSEAVCASVFGVEYKRSVTELHRLVIIDDTPKNTESWFIVRALRLLKRDRPNYNAVLSFADATEGHLGVIYQATNAIYTGTSGKATFFLDPSGRLRHPRQNGQNITKDEAALRNWTPVKRDGKHRYLYLLGNGQKHKKALLKGLKLPSLPYPKEQFNEPE
tara:strand:+ start:5997 stop:6632 length:636 start_codon:yes stop_codon:yes gene_type:complete